MTVFRKLFLLLTPAEQKKAGLLLILTLVMAFIDMVGVASILPFMAVLANPELVDTNIVLNNIYKIFESYGMKSKQQFLFILGGFMFCILILSLIIKAITSYAQARFIYMREYTIGRRLAERYLFQSYSWFLDHHSSDLGKSILSEVQQVILNGMRPFFELITKTIVAFAILILLTIVDFKLTAIITIVIVGTYIIIFYIVRGNLNQIGKDRLLNNQLRFKVMTEAFNAIKEIKIRNLENVFLKLFSNPSKKFSHAQASSQIISQLPRFILEAIAFGGIILIVLFIMAQKGNLNNSLPIVSLYAFAGYRLIPAIQQIYASFAQLTFIEPSLNKLHNDFKNLQLSNKIKNEKILFFKEKIVLKDIFYSYPESSRSIIKNISLTIPVKSTVGFIGKTGSGKTTIIDIILGLLMPQKGTVEIDEKIVTANNVKSWQQIIGYVPQDNYLSDDTIAANIAFGIDPNNIDQFLVKKAAKLANINDFIEDELSEKYQTVVGERGVKLSGGQSQRIGIARALYKNPQVLVLDEATSALDNQTENDLIETIKKLKKNITIIIIAHRLNTLKNCDIIFEIDKGKLTSKNRTLHDH